MLVFLVRHHPSKSMLVSFKLKEFNPHSYTYVCSLCTKVEPLFDLPLPVFPVGLDGDGDREGEDAYDSDGDEVADRLCDRWCTLERLVPTPLTVGLTRACSGRDSSDWVDKSRL